MANMHQIPISTSNVLLLSDLSNFREGSTLVREQEGLRLDIFRSFTSAKDTQGAIQALRRYGPDEPQLYVDALTYFASSPAILEEAGDELDVVLRRIDEDGLLSPLQVIQALSNNAVVTMGRVKKYLSDNIDRERKDISTVRNRPRWLIFCISGTEANNFILRIVVSSQVTSPKLLPSSKNSTTSLPNRSSFNRAAVNPAVAPSTCPPSTFCVDIPSTNAVSTASTKRPSAPSAHPQTRPFEPSASARWTRPINTIYSRGSCSGPGTGLGSLVISLAGAL